MTADDAEEMMEEAAAKLGEHFSSVQILASLPVDGGGTSGFKVGVGDWFARQGLAHAFIQEDVASDNARHIARQLNTE